MSLVHHMRYYTPEQLTFFRDRTFDLLEKRGVKMDHQPVMELLRDHGADVDTDAGIVRFPRAVMETLLTKVPEQFQLKARNPDFTLDFPHPKGLFHTRVNTGGQNWLDPDTGAFRRVTLKDLAYWARLADRLDHIDFIPYLVADDAPPATADVHALAVMLENAEKHIWIQPYTGESVEYLVKLLAAAAGGEDELRENPLASWITCSLTPLVFKWMDMEIIFQAAGHGCALQCCSLPGSGVTAPFTPAGSVLVSAAENLVMIAAAQAVRPGTPVIATSLQFSGDMRTGRSLQSSAESLRQSALFVQVMREAFLLETHTYGAGCDSPDIDGQGMAERAMRAMLMAASGASVLGGAGQFETACSVSPVALAVDDELFKIAKAVMKEMRFDDEHLAWDELMAMDYGGEFLSSQHTFRHCREVDHPISFTRDPRDTWAGQGARDLNARVGERITALMKEAGPTDLARETKTEIADIVRLADKHLC
ncbi:MAG: trimethylamine methyltransferase family protein [Desulfobacter sp.]